MRYFRVGLLWLLMPLAIVQGSALESSRPRLKSIYSGVHQLAEFVQPETRALVLIFVTDTCPVAQRYVPSLKELDTEFSGRGVRLLAIYVGARTDVMTMAAHAEQQDLPFPALLDVRQQLARQMQVSATPEAVLLDRKLNKHFQGAIDNQFRVRGQLKAATRHYLKDAIEQLLARKSVEPSHVEPSGCPIETLPRLPVTREVTFYREVAPILQKRCQACHREGGAGPFELLTYDDAYYNSAKIREVVVDRRMPPWHGVLNPRYGQLHNDKRLTEEERRTLLGWIDRESPEGNPADAPRPIRWPKADEWSIGKPDYVYKVPAPFPVPKSGVLDYQFFRVKLNLKDDRWLQAVEVRPGDPSVVHHIALHLVEAGDEKFVGFGGMVKLYGFSTEKAQLLNDYVPGDHYNAKIYPDSQAVRVPKNMDLMFEVHYTPNNRAATTDQSMVAFRWATAPPREEVLTRVFRKPIGRFRIPAFASHYKIEDSYYFEEDVLVDAIRPHFHLRGKSYRLEIVQRNEDSGEVVERTTVLTVPVWDPSWQRTYELQTPMLVPAGMELLATGRWDNSSLNPNNPNPAVMVEWGQQSSDEMFSTRFKYRRAPPSESQQKP